MQFSTSSDMYNKLDWCANRLYNYLKQKRKTLEYDLSKSKSKSQFAKSTLVLLYIAIFSEPMTQFNFFFLFQEGGGALPKLLSIVFVG